MPLTFNGKCKQCAASLKEYCHYQGMKIAIFLNNKVISFTFILSKLLV